MAIYHQYQPPHQIHSMFAKFDRLLDMMESRIDAVDRRVENLRRKQYPSPHQSGRLRNIPDGFFSRHPEDAANRCVGYPRAPPLPEPPPHPTPSPPYAQRTRRNYLPHSQPPSAYEPLPPTGWLPRPQPSSVRQPTCWDPPEQPGYPPHEPPTMVEPLHRECAKFRRLPQQPQPHRYRREVEEDSAVSPIYLSCSPVPSCSPDEDSGIEGRLLNDSDESITSCVCIARIRWPSREQVGVEEKLLDDGPPQSAPILQLYDSNISKEEDGSTGEVEKKITSVNVSQMSSTDVENCWFKRGGACTGARIIPYIYVDFFDGDVPSIVHRSTSLDVDARFIPPRNEVPYLSILGGDKGKHSAVRCVFDPGGHASPKLLLSTLFVASWFPP